MQRTGDVTAVSAEVESPEIGPGAFGGETARVRVDAAGVRTRRAVGVLAVSLAAAPWPVHASTGGAGPAPPREIDPGVPTAIAEPAVPPAPAPRRVEPWEELREQMARRPQPVPSPPPYTSPTGEGLMIGGGIALGVGVLGLLGGGLLRREALEDDRPGCRWESGPDDCNPRLIPGGGGGVLMFFAAPLAGAGLVMLVVGLGHRRAYREHRKRWERRVQPQVQRTAHGSWTAGMTLRF